MPIMDYSLNMGRESSKNWGRGKFVWPSPEGLKCLSF